MKSFCLKSGLTLLLLVAAMSGIYAQCNPPINVEVSTNHYPFWSSLSVDWAVPAGTEEAENADGNNSVVIYNRGVGFNTYSVFGKTTFGATSTYDELGSLSSQFQCMEYANGILFVLDKSVTGSGRFGFFEPQTMAVGAGGFYLIGTDLPNIASMAWNPVTSQMYATIWDNNNSSGYGTINIKTGEYTPIGTLPGIFTIAIDNNGDCYAVKIDNTGKFGTVNLATGVFTQIADYTENLGDFQSIEVNRKTNKLYWNRRIVNSSGNTVLYEINKTSGALTAGPTLMGGNFPAISFSIMDAVDDKTPRYNIFRDKTKLNTQPMFTPFYRDLAPESGTFEYCVSAVYANPVCESQEACAEPFVLAGECDAPVALPLTEGFNIPSVFPPRCWTLSSTGSSVWQHTTSGVQPFCSPQEGAGMVYFGSNNANSGTRESLITPRLVTENKDQILSFWMYRNGDNANGADKIDIFVSQTPSTAGLTSLLTVHRSNLLSPQVAADGWYQYFVTVPCAAMDEAYILFEGYSDFGRNIHIDNIQIGDLCVPIQSVTASLYGNGTTLNHAHVTWTAPEAASASLIGYNVYRNDVQIAANVNALEYNDETDLQPGEYVYSVKAAYNNTCGEAEAKYASSLLVVATSATAAAPANVKAETQANDWYDVKLTWDNPTKKDLFYTKAHNNEFGASNGVASTFTVVSRWAPEDLTLIDGLDMTKISFIPAAQACTYTVKIWQGGTAINNPGSLVHQQALTTSSLTIGQWNEITLSAPVPMDATKELWIGIECVVQQGYPIGMDYSVTVKPGYSDLSLWTTGEWMSINNAFDYPANWCLGATVGVGESTEVVLGYNVYRDNIMLTAGGYVSEITYTDRVPGPGSYVYGVSALYDNFSESEHTEITVNVEQSPCETPVTGFEESFENDQFPSLCWESISTDAAPWQRVVGMGIQPECYPYEGNAMVMYNCRRYTEGKTGLLVMPSLETGKRYRLTFWMTRDDAYNWPEFGDPLPDRLNIYMSEDNTITGLTPLKTIHRHVELDPAVPGNFWYEYAVEVNTADMATARFIFEGVSAYGGNIFIDKIKVEETLCSWTENVYVEMQYNGDCGAVLTWDAVDGSNIFNIYRDDVLIAPDVAGNTYTDNDFTLGEHTWCVKAVCPQGGESAANCVTQTCAVPIFTIVATSNDNGTITPSGEQTVSYGEDLSFTFAANGNYEIGKVLIDGVNNADAVVTGAYTFENVTDDHTIEIVFQRAPIVPTPNEDGIIFITADGFGNGSSWENGSYDLQSAINMATSENEIWVAKGVYYPTQKAAQVSTDASGNNPVETTDRHRAFTLKKDVKIYGGFAGTEASLAERILSAENASTLSGDFNGNDAGAPAGNNTSMHENAYHVAILVGDAGTALLDGFTITGGYANQYNYIMVNDNLLEQRCGGGFYLVNTSLEVRNLIVKGNWSQPNGAGMFLYNSSPVITNVLFTENADNNGAGNAIYNRGSSPVLTNVTIVGNKPGASGSAIYNNNITGENPITSLPVIRNSILYNNGNSNSVNNTSVTFVNTYAQRMAAATEGLVFTNISDPLLEADFTLNAMSPLINAGNRVVFNEGEIPDLSGITTDLAGNARVVGSNVDLGAFEYQETPLIFTADANGVVYVTEQGAGTKDGSSWQNAAEGLANVLFLAPMIDDLTQIWVKQGVYKPAHISVVYSSATARDRAFVMIPDVKIYGSFAGTETSLEQRNISEITSVLSGDLNGDDNGTDEMLADNVYHVVLAAGAMGTATLDGFVVTKGYANASSSVVLNEVSSIGQNDGAGIFVKGTSSNLSAPVLSNLVVTGNKSTDRGGAMYLEYAPAVITDVTISSNIASNGTTVGMGGGMYFASNSHATMTNVKIVDNTCVAMGGGIYITGSTPILTNILVSGNEALGTNTGANGNGGGINVASGSIVMTNVTITGNTAHTLGGGLNVGGLPAIVRNAVIYGNEPANIAATATASTYTNSLIGDVDWATSATDGGNNLTDVAPMFMNAANGNYRLDAGSPAINAGSNAFFEAGQTPDLSAITTDLDGNARIFETAVDMGAYEFQHVIIATAGAGGTITPAGHIQVTEGNSYPFTIAADEGYNIATVLVDDVNVAEAVTSGSYTFANASGVHTIHAGFELKNYTVGVTASPAAGGTVTGSGTYTHGSQATVTAIANTTYNFVSWSENNAVISNEATYSFAVTGDRNLVANFELKTFNVSLTINPAESGTVTGDGVYEYGATASAVAEPATGYRFVNWTEAGEQVSINATYNFTVRSDRNLTANFETMTFAVTYNAPANGTLTVTAGGAPVASGTEVDYGTVLTITAIPEDEYKLTTLTVNGENFASGNTHTAVADVEIVAVFDKLESINGNTLSSVSVYGSDKNVCIDNKGNVNLKLVQITDVLGRAVYQGSANTSVVIPVNAATGIYIVKLVSEDDSVVSAKVYLTE
ncbi:MAG: hypothetical protein LBV41_05605 [Cytophagaceae bacterium]|jgi:hypothetical protein|nr:hypothetical protein [Cytophagaceae bacterium]